MTSHDVDKTWEFRQRPHFFLAGGMVLLLLALFALTVAIVLVPIVLTQPKVMDLRNASVGALFALGGALVFWNGLSSLKIAFSGDVVLMRIDPKGFWNHRSTRGRVIPWSVVEDVYHDSFGYTRGTKVRVDQATFKMLYPRILDRVLHALNWLLLGPVIAIHTGGLDARPGQIHEITESYAIAYGGLLKAR